jgi:hypothetical protein
VGESDGRGITAIRAATQLGQIPWLTGAVSGDAPRGRIPAGTTILVSHQAQTVISFRKWERAAHRWQGTVPTPGNPDRGTTGYRP